MPKSKTGRRPLFCRGLHCPVLIWWFCTGVGLFSVFTCFYSPSVFLGFLLIYSWFCLYLSSSSPDYLCLPSSLRPAAAVCACLLSGRLLPWVYVRWCSPMCLVVFVRSPVWLVCLLPSDCTRAQFTSGSSTSITSPEPATGA